jgi:rhomboid protease GluP
MEPVVMEYDPEILPPGAGATGPQEPARRERSWWASSPATYLLLGINCAVFLWMLVHHISYINPSPDELMAFGANNAGAVLINDEWWRIVTAMFVHVGIIHLATNMWCLWNLGMLAEPLMGSAGLLAVYVLTGAAGNLLSVFVTRGWFYDPSQVTGGWFGPVGAGASGAVFGIAGALIVLLKSHWLPVPAEELRKLRRSVIYFAGINLVIGLATMIPGSFVKIDNMAHMGGCACGLLFAAPMVPRIGAPKNLFFVRRRIAVGVVVLVLTLFAFFIASFQG